MKINNRPLSHFIKNHVVRGRIETDKGTSRMWTIRMHDQFGINPKPYSWDKEEMIALLTEWYNKEQHTFTVNT